jgi:hypothetical protein
MFHYIKHEHGFPFQTEIVMDHWILKKLNFPFVE